MSGNKPAGFAEWWASLSEQKKLKGTKESWARRGWEEKERRVKEGGNGKFSDLKSDGGMDPRPMKAWPL